MSAHIVDIPAGSVTRSALDASVRVVTRCEFCHQGKWQGEQCQLCDLWEVPELSMSEFNEVLYQTRRKIVRRGKAPSKRDILNNVINHHGYYDRGELHLNDKGLKILGIK